jgi:hypothetical protein
MQRSFDEKHPTAANSFQINFDTDTHEVTAAQKSLIETKG